MFDVLHINTQLIVLNNAFYIKHMLITLWKNHDKSTHTIIYDQSDCSFVITIPSMSLTILSFTKLYLKKALLFMTTNKYPILKHILVFWFLVDINIFSLNLTKFRRVWKPLLYLGGMKYDLGKGDWRDFHSTCVSPIYIIMAKRASSSNRSNWLTIYIM
jgi:hypothetical protein